jgi:cell division protein FtsL
MEIILIVLSVVMVALVIILAILLYHMFLAYNEVNKRLLALASEAISNQRITQEEIDSMIRNLDRVENTTVDDEVNEPFDPHQY